MTNQEVISAFKQGIESRSLNMTSTGDKLYSYNTVVAQWIGKICVLNATRYSNTTSKQLCHFKGYEDVKTVGYIPRGTQDLTPYLPKEEEEKFLTFQDCYDLVKSLAKSQGTYGRIRDEWDEFDTEQIKKAEAQLKELKFREPIDFILWLEN